jgi:hypothetical protein
MKSMKVCDDNKRLSRRSSYSSSLAGAKENKLADAEEVAIKE